MPQFEVQVHVGPEPAQGVCGLHYNLNLLSFLPNENETWRRYAKTTLQLQHVQLTPIGPFCLRLVTSTAVWEQPRLLLESTGSRAKAGGPSLKLQGLPNKSAKVFESGPVSLPKLPDLFLIMRQNKS